MPMVRHMLSALKSSGCPVDLTSQISCEMCQQGPNIEHLGGYDEKYNQIFICSNNCTSPGQTHGVLVRNLFHMFDRCVNQVDFNNPDHLACTEIRKANLAGCGWLVYISATTPTWASSGSTPTACAPPRWSPWCALASCPRTWPAPPSRGSSPDVTRTWSQSVGGHVTRGTSWPPSRRSFCSATTD